MKLLPLAALSCLLITAGPAAWAQSTQQLMSDAQTSFIRGDMVSAKRDFQMVVKIDPRNQVAINYLRMIQVQEAKNPKGNGQELALSKVILPKLEFREATLGSAIEYLKQAVTKATGGKQAVNFVVNLPEEQTKTQAISLSLTDVPFTEVLRYVGDLAAVQFEYEKYAIKVSPKAGATASATAPAPAPSTTPAVIPIPGLQ